MPRHENCEELLASLSEYIDGEASSDMCAQIERHLEACPDCRILVDTLRKTVYLYQTLEEDPSMPSEVRARLYKTLHLREPRPPQDQR
jgi:anti-sigma factor (TIGR02949 family)